MVFCCSFFSWLLGVFLRPRFSRIIFTLILLNIRGQKSQSAENPKWSNQVAPLCRLRCLVLVKQGAEKEEKRRFGRAGGQSRCRSCSDPWLRSWWLIWALYVCLARGERRDITTTSPLSHRPGKPLGRQGSCVFRRHTCLG